MKKINLLVISSSFPTKVNKLGAIFTLNQLIYLQKYCNIKVIAPFPYIIQFPFVKKLQRLRNVPLKEKVENISIYHPRYIGFPKSGIFSRLVGLTLLIETYTMFHNAVSLIETISKKWKFDLIHVHGPVAEGFIGRHLKAKYNKPLVLTLHGEDVTKYARMMYLRRITSNTLNSCDGLISVSNSLLKELNNMKYSYNNSIVIPSGYRIDRFNQKSKLLCRNKLNIPQNIKVITYVGDVIKRKGIKYLINAADLVAKKQKVNFYIIGEGPEKKSLLQLTEKLNLKNKIFFTGEKKHDEISTWLNASDLFVLPTLNEGMPMVIAESFACGVPVVATNVAGIPEMINKDVGILVKPKDHYSLAQSIILALNKKWNKKLILNQAKEFSINNSVNKLDRFYNDIIKKYST